MDGGVLCTIFLFYFHFIFFLFYLSVEFILNGWIVQYKNSVWEKE